MKILTASPFETLFHPPQIHQKSQQPKNTTLANKHFRSRGVAKIVFDVPMLHGTRFFFDCHAAWERDFSLLRHLPRENVIFFIFSTRPQRKAQKHRKPHHGVMLWTCRRERCKMQIATKIHPCPEGYDRDEFFT